MDSYHSRDCATSNLSCRKTYSMVALSFFFLSFFFCNMVARTGLTNKLSRLKPNQQTFAVKLGVGGMESQLIEYTVSVA